MAYFLFMQEQRQRVPGWSNRSNAELQRLCDPLWKALSKEEKAVYKEKKRSLRRTERENRLQLRIPQEAKRVEFEGKRWTVRVGRVESPDLIWVVPDISDLAVQRLMSDIAAAPLEVSKYDLFAFKYQICSGVPGWSVGGWGFQQGWEHLQSSSDAWW